MVNDIYGGGIAYHVVCLSLLYNMIIGLFDLNIDQWAVCEVVEKPLEFQLCVCVCVFVCLCVCVYTCT